MKDIRKRMGTRVVLATAAVWLTWGGIGLWVEWFDELSGLVPSILYHKRAADGSREPVYEFIQGIRWKKLIDPAWILHPSGLVGFGCFSVGAWLGFSAFRRYPE